MTQLEYDRMTVRYQCGHSETVMNEGHTGYKKPITFSEEVCERCWNKSVVDPKAQDRL